jgi:hypothetical protein
MSHYQYYTGKAEYNVADGFFDLAIEHIKKMWNNPRWGMQWVVALFFFLLAAISVLPVRNDIRKAVWTDEVNVKPDQIISTEEAVSRVQEIGARMLSRSGNYKAEDTLKDQTELLTLERYTAFEDKKAKNAIVAGLQVREQLFNAASSQSEVSLYNQLTKTDKAFNDIANFRPTDFRFHSDEFWNYFRTQYPLGMLFASIGILILMKLRGLRILPEFIPPFQFIAAVATWPVSWMVYPYEDPKQQIKKVVNISAYCISFLLSVTGGVFAQTVKKASGDEEKKRKDDHTLVIEDTNALTVGPDPKTDPVKYTLTTMAATKYLGKIGVVAWNKPVNQSELTASWKNGSFLDLWTSTGFDKQSNFGDEVDYTVGWAGKHWSMGATWIDLSPQLSMHGGDILQSAITFQQSFNIQGQSMTAYVEADRLEVTEDPSKNSSSFGLAGIKFQRPWRKLSMGSDVSVMKETGIFGSKPVLLKRFIESMSLQVNKTLTLTPVKLYVVTPNRSSGRGISNQVSSGLTLSFN